MAQNKETRVPKTSTFEEWRQSTNKVSFDVGPIESDSNKSADSLDKETRLTDQAKTINVGTGVSTVNANLDSGAAWRGHNSVFAKNGTAKTGNVLYGFGGQDNGLEPGGLQIANQKFSVAANGNITLAANTSIWATNNLVPPNGSNIARDGSDGGAYIEFNTFIEDTTWRGKTLTFAGTVGTANVNSRYEVKAFIKSLNSATGYSVVEETSVDIDSTGAFSISLSITEGNTIVPQVGFLFGGVNAQAGQTPSQGSIIINSATLTVGPGANQIIDSNEEFIRDQSSGANNVGIRVDFAPDEKLDMTAGYIIVEGTSGAPADFVAGKSVHQFTGNSSSNTREFAADIVSVLKSGSNIRKILIKNAIGAFNPALNLGAADNYSTQTIAAARLVRQVVGSLNVGYVRVYKTTSGTTTKLTQSVTDINGFHLPRATFALPFTSGASQPSAAFVEGERIYQTTNNTAEASDNVPFFTANILIALGGTAYASKYGLGTHGGLILYDTTGTFDPSKLLRSTTAAGQTIAASRYSATHNDCVIDQTFSSIIRLNTPAVSGDSFEIEYASAVDAIVELQDDIGKIEDLVTNTVQAGFGASGDRKTLSTSDLVVMLNKLQDMIGNAAIPTISNNTHLVPANVNTISDAAKNIVTFIGDTDLSDANLGATANASSTLTDAITTIKTFIGSTDISDITSGETVTSTIARVHDEIGDVAGDLASKGFTDDSLGTNVPSLSKAIVEIRDALVGTNDLVTTIDTLDGNAGTAANYAADDVVAAIVEIQKIIGDRAGLVQNTLGDVTDTPTNIVAAINNIKAYIGTTVGISTIKSGTNDDTITGAVKQLHDEIGEQALSNGTNYNTAAETSLSHAIHGIQGMLGDVSVNGIGAANTVSSAINKMHGELGDPDSLNANPVVAYSTQGGSENDGSGGFRNATGGSDATVVSALTELRQALVGDGADLAVVGSAARTDNDTSATIALAKADLANLNGYSKTNIIDSILEIQELLGDITSLTSATNDFNTANVVASLVELKTALVGADDLTDTIATLNTVDASGTDFNTGNVVDAIREIQTDIGTLSSLASTPFAADANIEGSYTNTTFKDIIASTNEYIGAANISDISSGNNTITGALEQLHDELGPISNAKLGINANRSKTYASGGANGATTVTVNNVAGLVEGMVITGTNIPAGTKIQSISNNTITLTQAISGGATSGTLVFTTEDVQSAILVNDTNIGDTQLLDDEVGYTKQIIAPAIKEIQGLIGDIQDNNLVPILNSVNTRITRDTDAAAAAGDTTIPIGDTTGITVGMKVKNTESGRTGSIAAGTLVTTVNVGVSIEVAPDVVSTINSGDTLQFDSPTVVNAVRSIDARIGQQVTPANMGTTATTLVTAIKEITDEIGAVTAGNLGTTSSNLTAAIKEIVDGTGAATVTVKGVASQQPTGKLNKVSATAQTIIGDINFNAPGSGVSEATTITLGNNTVLDVSSGVLKMSANAAGVFNVSSAFIQLLPSSATGAGLQIDRSGITGVAVQSGEKALFQWQENAVSTNNPASAHNQSDIAWRIKGLTSATSPQEYTLPNVDFQNAYRLFGIGTTNVANSMSNVTVAWDSTNHNFDISLNDTTTDMTSGSDAGNATYGTTAKIPQITVDRQGRISAMDEVDMANFLGTFNVQGDSGSQAVVQGINVKFAGTAGEIETAVTDESGTKTVTIGLPNNVDIDGTFGAAGNVNLVSGNGASSVITLGGSNTTTTVAGTLNIPGILNVTGTNNSVTVSNTTITGDALVLRTEDDGVPANTDTPKFVINRGFSTTKTITQLVAGQRYKIVSGTGFTSVGADNNTAGTVFTATGAGTGNATAKIQRNEAAIVWNEQYDHFILTRGGDAGAVRTNTTQGAIIAQGDTIGSATKFTAAVNTNNEDKQVLFADVTGSTSPLQRNTGLLFNPSTNKLTLSSGQLDLGNFKHLNGVTHINTATNAKPLEISRLGGSESQLMKVGITDNVAIFDYIEDTAGNGEGKNNFGKYRFLLNGNHADADEITDRMALEINKDSIIARGLTVNTNGIAVTGGSTLGGALNHTGMFTQERHDVDSATVLGHELNNRIIGAHFQSKVTTSGNKSILQIEDRRSTATTDGAEVYSSATKGIQHRIDGTYMSFLDFQATSGHDHQAILGGISHGARKTYISGNGISATKIYNNINAITASELVFETKAGGAKVIGDLEVTSDAIVRDTLTIGTFHTENTTHQHGTPHRSLSPQSALHIIDITATSHTDNVLATLEANIGDIGATPTKVSMDFKIQDTNNPANMVSRISSAVSHGDTPPYGGTANESQTNLIFGTCNDGGAYGEKMIITGRGAVGIGTLNPGVTLDVDGTTKANSFVVIRDDANAEIRINQATVPAGQSTNSINKVRMTTTTNTDRDGILQVQSAQLGTTAGNSTTQAVFKARDGNTSYLQIIDQRDTNGIDWTFAHKRLEFGIDTTRMGYIAQNLNENYGLEIGTAGNAGAVSADSFTPQPWIRFRKAASDNGAGAVELYHGNSGTSSLKLQTTSDGAEISGNLLLNSNTSRLRIGNHANYDANSNTSSDVANSAIYVRTNGATDARVVIEADSNNANEGANPSLILYQDGQRVGGKIELTKDNNVEATDCLANSLLISHLHNDTEGDYGLQFATDGDAPEYGSVIPKVRMTILSEGNVGIGLNNPAQKLDVAGNIKLSGIIDQNGTGTNDFEGQIDCNQDVKTTQSGKGFYAFGGGTDYLTMTHDGSGGHIDSSDQLEIATPTFKVLNAAKNETMIQAVDGGGVGLYHNNSLKLETTSTGVKVVGPNVAEANIVKDGLFNNSTLETGRINFARGGNTNDFAEIKFCSEIDANANAPFNGFNRSCLDFIIGDDYSNTVPNADKFRFRFDPHDGLNSGNVFSLVEINAKTDGSTFIDLTRSAIGTASEVKAATFTGDLSGNASTASTLSATLAIAKGGTNATSFSNKAAIVMNDAGTAFTSKQMDGIGELLIGGSTGPEPATLTEGEGINITNADNSITIKGETASDTNLGIAKFNTANFLVTSGDVTIKDGGVATAEIANDAVTFAKMQNIATDRIMGRTAANSGDAKALTASEARGILNVENGADNYANWKVGVNQNNGTEGDTVDINSTQTLRFQGNNATSITRSGNKITISSNNTTYSAAGGTSSTDDNGIYLNGTEFKLGSNIRPHADQIFGNSDKTQIEFTTVDGSAIAIPQINMYTSESTGKAFTLIPAKYFESEDYTFPQSSYANNGVIGEVWSVQIRKPAPTMDNEVSNKAYVDSQREFMGGCRVGNDGLADDLHHCTVTRLSAGKWEVKIAAAGSGDGASSAEVYLVPALGDGGNRYSGGDEGTTGYFYNSDAATPADGAANGRGTVSDVDNVNKGTNFGNDLPIGTGPLEIRAWFKSQSASETIFQVEIVEQNSRNYHWDNSDQMQYSRYYKGHTDSAWTCMFKAGRGLG